MFPADRFAHARFVPTAVGTSCTFAACPSRYGNAAAGTYEAGNEDYKVLKNLSWPSFTHPQSMARWIYNGNTFWSFDTPEAIADKMHYVRSRNLGGAFHWEFSGDDANGSLAKAVGNGLR